MGKKIGIMGGTFNPVHYGHLLLAESAREVFELDKVLFMPSGDSYMKDASSILHGETRMQMLKLAIDGNPYFEISRIELDRTGPTYTCDTLAQLQQQNSEDTYYFIMGADSLLMLESWKDPEYVLRNCTIAAAVRGTGTDKKTFRRLQGSSRLRVLCGLAGESDIRRLSHERKKEKRCGVYAV